MYTLHQWGMGHTAFFFLTRKTQPTKPNATTRSHLKRNNGRSSSRPLGVLDHSRRPALHDGHARIRRAQIDTDDVARGALGRQGAPRRGIGGRCCCAQRGGSGGGSSSTDLRQLPLRSYDMIEKRRCEHIFAGREGQARDSSQKCKNKRWVK